MNVKAKLMTLQARLAKFQTLGSTVDEKDQVKKLLNSSPSKFLSIVATIEQYSDLNIMSFEEAISRLKAYKKRVKPTEPTKDSSGKLLLTRVECQEKQKIETRQASKN